MAHLLLLEYVFQLNQIVLLSLNSIYNTCKFFIVQYRRTWENYRPLTIGIIYLNSGIIFTQNETSEIEDSSLISTPELEESIKTNNNTSSYENDNNESIIEKILP